jgi:acyl carrier protein phosphodiesterase
MSQIVGLIELDADGTTVIDLATPCDDATLDELFARLVGGNAATEVPDDAADTIELAADLDLLCEDLSLVAGKLRHAIFLTRGDR